MKTLNVFVLVMIEIGLISLRICEPLVDENALNFRTELEPLSSSHLTLARDQTDQDVMMKSESGENGYREMGRDDKLSTQVKTTRTTNEDFNEPLIINPNADSNLFISEQDKILIEKDLNSARRHHSNPIKRLNKILRSCLSQNSRTLETQRVGKESFKDEKVVLSEQKAQKDIQPKEDEMNPEEMNLNERFKEPEKLVGSVKENKTLEQRKISVWEAIRNALTLDFYLFKLFKNMWANWFKHLSAGKKKPTHRSKKIPITEKVFKNEDIQNIDHNKEATKLEKLSPSDLKEFKVQENSKDEDFHSSELTVNIKPPLSEETKQDFQSEEELGPALQFLEHRSSSSSRNDDLNQDESERDELMRSNNIQFLPPSPSFSMSSKDFKSMIQSKEFHPYTTSPNFDTFIHSTENQIDSDATTPKFEHFQPVINSPEVPSEPLSLEDTYALIHPTENDPESSSPTVEKKKSQTQFSEIIPDSNSPREEPTIDSPECLSSPHEDEDENFEPVYEADQGEWDYLKIRKPIQSTSSSSSSPSSINSKDARQKRLRNSLRRNYSKNQFLRKSSKGLKVLKKSKSQKVNRVSNPSSIHDDQPKSGHEVIGEPEVEPKPTPSKPWMYQRLLSWF
ncbi:uncharacterized protein MELLADRAFT_88224 [Melampsora larici-populina 98AG31]|uniref:Secreted protein n=1 Tax=Melampsora larici-populina (strain 98AG31 / pathotype 3-4-7) TaxID=747676 RepID=F4RR05_MELLP|nr:uncharacterized protein MELLADRAFT_88224 [Melampsora larici-populina 98AG31]EGG05128.1 hypothetical protein MELLADRAFT_88224 [Melampsora larici-populina 98AG31]